MYDILQLSDMLVPELVDVANKMKIAEPDQFSKQDLIYKILDKQALLESTIKKPPVAKKAAKRARTVTATTGISTEVAEVMEQEAITEAVEAGSVSADAVPANAAEPTEPAAKPAKRARKPIRKGADQPTMETPAVEQPAVSIQRPEPVAKQQEPMPEAALDDDSDSPVAIFRPLCTT